MSGRDAGCSRRGFVRAALGGVAGALVPLGGARAASFSTDVLQVWSCGGLSEGMRELNAAYERRAGVRIHYTGAFAAALGKSLLGSAHTDVLRAACSSSHGSCARPGRWRPSGRSASRGTCS